MGESYTQNCCAHVVASHALLACLFNHIAVFAVMGTTQVTNWLLIAVLWGRAMPMTLVMILISALTTAVAAAMVAVQAPSHLCQLLHRPPNRQVLDLLQALLWDWFRPPMVTAKRMN
jgi:hypothetical protein